VPEEQTQKFEQKFQDVRVLRKAVE